MFIQRFGRWVTRRHCSHPLISQRCVHGDEILLHKFKRRACTLCGRSVGGPLLDVCTVTGWPHSPPEE